MTAMKRIESRDEQLKRIGLYPLVTQAELERELELAEERGAAQALSAQYLTIKEAARLLGCCRETIYNYINTGRLTYVTSIGGRRLIPAMSLIGLKSAAA